MEPMKDLSRWSMKRFSGEVVRASTFLLVIAGLVLSFMPPVSAENSLSFTYDNGDLFGGLELGNFGLGGSRFGDDSFGLALSVKDVELGLDKWKIRPFVLGEYSISEGFRPKNTFGGVNLQYFDYQIGGYLISFDSTLWANLTSYKVLGNGSYSIGNIDLSLSFGSGLVTTSYSPGWYPRVDPSNWQELLSSSYLGAARSLSDHFLLSGGKKLFPGEIGIKWSQGVLFDPGETIGPLGFVEELSWKGNRLSAIIKNLQLEKLLVHIRIESLGAGFISSFDEPVRYGLMLDYDSDVYFGLEVTTPAEEFEPSLSFLARW